MKQDNKEQTETMEDKIFMIKLINSGTNKVFIGTTHTFNVCRPKINTKCFETDIRRSFSNDLQINNIESEIVKCVSLDDFEKIIFPALRIWVEKEQEYLSDYISKKRLLKILEEFDKKFYEAEGINSGVMEYIKDKI